MNNFGLVNENLVPSVIEISFAKKEFIDTNNHNKRTYPLNIDKPCNKDYKDEDISFY